MDDPSEPEAAQEDLPQEPAAMAFGDVRLQLTAIASSTYQIKYNTEYTVSADTSQLRLS